MAGGRLVSLDRLVFFFEDATDSSQHGCFLSLGHHAGYGDGRAFCSFEPDRETFSVGVMYLARLSTSQSFSHLIMAMYQSIAVAH